MKKMNNPGCIPEEKLTTISKPLKFLILIIFSAVLMVCMQNVSAQTKKVTIYKDDASLEEILRIIQKQTGLNYLLNHEEIPENTKISIHVKGVSVEKALELSLKGLPLTYKIRNNAILIVPKSTGSNPGNYPLKNLTQTIRGRIVDKETNVGLPGANIILLESSPIIGSISDVNGYFRLEKVPVGRHNLKVSYIGYKELTIPEIMVSSAKEVVLTLSLTESVTDIEEIVMRPFAKGAPKNDMAIVSARSFSVEESNRYAGGVSDPGRMALSFAGVNTNDDLSNQIVVRGNSPNGMIWRVEGVQIPVPNHFYEEGYDAGYVSVLSSNMMSNSDFYTGAFPAEYGNGTSGVFDISLRNGNNEKSEKSFQIGILGSDVSIEGPFSKNYKGSYLVNARYSTFSVMNSVMDVLMGDYLPEYTDVSYKINLPSGKTGTFSLWGLGGLALLKDEPVADTSQWEFAFDNFGDFTKTRMGAAGITHIIFPDSKSYFKTVISYSGNYSKYRSYELDSSYSKEYDVNEKLTSSAARFSTLYNRKLSAKLSMRTGFIFSKLYFDYYSENLDSLGNWEPDIDGRGNTETYQGYIQLKYKLTEKLQVNGGVHYLGMTLNNDHSVEPRLGIKWFLNHSQTISAGFGIHSRHDLLMLYYVKIPDRNGDMYFPNKNLKLSKSNHYVLGYSKVFKRDMRLIVEAYYQHLYDIPVSPDTFYTYTGINDNVIWEPVVNKGLGRNFGIEFTLEKFFTNNYYFLITHSMFSAKYKPLDGKWYNSVYNNNYITNFTGGKEFRVRNKNILGVNARLLWSGGKRSTPLKPEWVEANNYAYQMEKHRNSFKNDDYLRMDLGVKYRINNARVSHEFAVDVQNVTGRLNIAYKSQYVDDHEQIQTYYGYLQGILPFFHYKIEF